MYIALTIDNNFAQHAGVTLCSLFENNSDRAFEVFLISDSSIRLSCLRLQQLVDAYSQILTIIELDDQAFKDCVVGSHITKAVYYRISLQDVLPAKVSKVIYLDSDIIVKDGLDELWHTDLTHFSLAAVPEPSFDRHSELGIPIGSPYFNSGMMAINLDYWRENKVAEKVIQYIRENPELVKYWDQDGLNVILQGKWLPMKSRWNQQTVHFTPEQHYITIEPEELTECLNNPAIIHYTAKFKPWHAWCSHPLKDEYYQYLSLTPWKNFRLTEHTRWHLLKQRAKKLINWVVRKDLFEVYA